MSLAAAALEWRRAACALLLLAQIKSSSHALRMTNLDLPELALQGDTIELTCEFSLDALQAGSNPRPAPLASTSSNSSGYAIVQEPAAAAAAELLYAVSWYKDEREFFRYLAQEWPHKLAFAADGISVDLEKSGNQSVTLSNISLRSSGVYKCEVSTDAPHFVTKSIERRMRVYTLPNEGPSIELANGGLARGSAPLRVFLADHVELRCVSRDSKPAAQLDWILNDKFNLTAQQAALELRAAFQVRTRRLVRLMAQQQPLGQEADSSGLLPPIAAADSAPTPAPQLSSTPHRRPASSETAAANKSAPPISLTSKSNLDHLAEFATSTLQFTLTPELLRALSAEQKSTRAPPTQAKLLAGRRQLADTAAAAAKPPRLQRRQASQTGSATPTGRQHNPGLSWRRSGPQSGQQRARAQTRSGGSKLVLKINCVARLLHLSMSDELKLSIVNSTREEAMAGTSSASMAEPSKQQSIGNAANGANRIDQMVYFLHILLGIMMILCVSRI